jgi:hypothetical protein
MVILMEKLGHEKEHLFLKEGEGSLDNGYFDNENSNKFEKI